MWNVFCSCGYLSVRVYPRFLLNLTPWRSQVFAKLTSFGFCFNFIVIPSSCVVFMSHYINPFSFCITYCRMPIFWKLRKQILFLRTLEHIMSRVSHFSCSSKAAAHFFNTPIFFNLHYPFFHTLEQIRAPHSYLHPNLTGLRG